MRDSSLLNTLERYASDDRCRWAFVSLQYFSVYVLFLKHVYREIANRYGSFPCVTGA